MCDHTHKCIYACMYECMYEHMCLSRLYLCIFVSMFVLVSLSKISYLNAFIYCFKCVCLYLILYQFKIK